ncbi:hypothetical protein FRC10_003842 [Ceratobasidium sp. 414]|nr:hypothetical protein FRC10_003842 [Ceratobasidium sp. 414]
MDEMRDRFMDQGFLWVKGLIPRSDILEFRRKYFEFMKPTGVLREGTESIEAMTKFVKEFTNWPTVKLLECQMLRANVPGAETAVHYDHIFLHYGPPTFLTGWLPFGDIAVEGGGLTYLENSVLLAQSIEDEFTRHAGKLTPEERINAFNANMMKGGVLSHDSQEFAQAHGNGKWLIANYEAGDIVFHHPFMIHASCVNESPTQTIRLATDLWFVNPNAPYDSRWTNYWRPNDGL